MACARVCGKYLKLSAKDSRQFTGSISLNTLIEPMRKSMTTPGFRYGADVTVNGTPAW